MKALKHKGWAAGIGVLLVLVLLVDRPRLLQQAIQTGVPEETRNLLDFDSYATGVNTILYAADGSIEYTLRAAGQIHYMSGVTMLESPFIRLHQANGQRWNIVASSGRIQPQSESDDDSAGYGIETLDLIDEVEIYQLDDFANRMLMQTDFLSVDPQLETLTTESAVRVEAGSITQTAIGMQADLTQNIIHFNSQVRGHYDPGQQDSQQ